MWLQAFWRAAGLSGEAVLNGGKPLSRDCDSGPLCVVFDCTSSFGNAALVAFIGGDQHLQYQALMVCISCCFYLLILSRPGLTQSNLKPHL